MSDARDAKDEGADLPAPDPEVLAENLSRLDALTRRFVAALAQRETPATPEPGTPTPGADLWSRAAGAWMQGAAADPTRLFEAQVNLWRDTLVNAVEAQTLAMKAASGIEPDIAEKKDRRFANPLWDTHPWFRFARDQYLAQTRAAEEMLKGLDGLTPREEARVGFFVRQVLDLLSPANSLATNPDALEKAVATQGASLVDGLENLVRDLERGGGELAVTLSDPDAFAVGQNIATAPGKVVFRNRLFELIQYAPTTEKVFRRPLVILPPWINKFYILDLKPQNSFIRHAVEQGHTVFVVSWVNPDATFADVGFDTYVHEGALAALDAAREAAGTKDVNAIGYCIGGTLLATTLAWHARHGKGAKPVANATFFTTLLDFAMPGDLGVFIDKDFLATLRAEMDAKGFLRGSTMARTFSYLRAGDLVYGPAVRSYMLGEAPPAFDLLYWNGDSTNLPRRMAEDYLTRLYGANELVAGTFDVAGDAVSLADIDIPTIAIATRTDHIAPWKASFSGISRLGGETTFILADSGHIAGIVNPPDPGKYGHWVNAERFDPADADGWFERATRHEGSWWPRWSAWMAERSGGRVNAREAKDALADAPGTYVAMSA